MSEPAPIPDERRGEYEQLLALLLKEPYSLIEYEAPSEEKTMLQERGFIDTGIRLHTIEPQEALIAYAVMVKTPEKKE